MYALKLASSELSIPQGTKQNYEMKEIKKKADELENLTKIPNTSTS